MATKVMYLLDTYFHSQAGTEGQLLKLIQCLDNSRYEPAVTLLRGSAYIEREGFVCPVRVLGVTSLASISALLAILRFGFQLRRQGYRLVHCFFNDASIIAPVVLKLLGIHVVVSRRDMGFWYTPLNISVLRLLVPFVDRYVANCRAVGRIVEQRERVPGRKISVIYNGYTAEPPRDEDILSVINLPEFAGGVITVGIVANLRPIKRLDTLINAFALVSKSYSNARLVIVGDTSSPQARSTYSGLEALARRLRIREHVIFTGRMERSMPWVRTFAVAVLCSESEGCSNSLLEYMQAKRAIVCTRTGGNPELIRDGSNGFLVEVGDVPALADRIITLLKDKPLAMRLGEAAYETVRTYTDARMVTEQMACYDDVLSAEPARGQQSSRFWL